MGHLSLVNGVSLTPLRQIAHPKGDIYHALKCSENDFSKFGEAYFSFVETGEIKGWKKHKQMSLNLVVPIGAIQFVIYDDRPNSPTIEQYSSVTLSAINYQRLHIPQGVWVAFKGKGTSSNMLLNLADLEHDPNEAENTELNAIGYDWTE